MTSIDFYFNAGDRLQVACRLAGKAMAQAKRVLIYAPDADTAGRIDRLLWTWPATGFVPHCAAADPLAAETPVLIAADAESPSGCDVLLNLSAECPPHFERFERLLEVISTDAAERESGRGRFRYYRDRGYAIANHDLAAAGASPSMAEAEPKDPNPLVRRVDALLRGRKEPGRGGEVPVLTEIVQDEARRARAMDPAMLEALARELESAVLERLGPEVERVIQERLGRTLNEVLAKALEGARTELTGSVTQMVREAVAASVAHALAPPKQD